MIPPSQPKKVHIERQQQSLYNLVKVEAGIENTPLRAHLDLARAGAEAEVSWDYTGACVGTHLAEVSGQTICTHYRQINGKMDN